MSNSQKLSEPTLISIKDITCDPALQARTAVREDVVAYYSERIRAGDKFPALDVFVDGERYLLVDGWHRLEALRQAQVAQFPCHLHIGTLDDARWFAIGSNRRNGLHRGMADRKHAVRMASISFPEKTQQQIADQIGCSQQFVATVQAELVSAGELMLPLKRSGADGKSRPAVYRKKHPAPMPAKPAAAAEPVSLENANEILSRFMRDSQAVVAMILDRAPSLASTVEFTFLRLLNQVRSFRKQQRSMKKR